jgi:uncharacterized protein YjiS (DUF1127 family)
MAHTVEGGGIQGRTAANLLKRICSQAWRLRVRATNVLNALNKVLRDELLRQEIL